MFFRKNKTQSKTKITSLLIGLGLCFLLKPSAITHAANSGYVLGIAPNFERFMYQTTVGTEDHNFNRNNYEEFNAVSLTHDNWRNISIPLTFDQTAWSVSKNSEADGCVDGDKCTMFLFPANTSNAAEKGPTDKDSEAISRVSTVISQLNQAISFVYNNAQKDGKPLSAHNLKETEKKELFAEITAKLGNATTAMRPGDVQHTETFTIDGTTTTFTITEKSEDSSFLTLKADTGKSIELRYRIKKYPEGKTEGTDDYDRSGEHPTIYWSHIVLMGNGNYVHRNVQSTNISELAPEGLVANILYALLNGALNGIRTLLGLEPISDIVFNEGTYKLYNWRGIAPTAWFEAGNILMWICQVIAWLTLALALVWRFGSTMWGTVTTFKYVTLVESIKDIFVASISTALIYPIFMTLTNFNVLLVDIMANLTIFNDYVDPGTIGGGTLAGILISILFFGIEIYFNFTYLLRGVTIVLLYGLAPMFFMVYAFGGGFKSITMKFIKELIGNIFIHTFHATFLAFFALFMNTTSSGLFTQIVLLYAFIPMTKLFKSLTGIGESDFISNTATQAKDTFKSTGTAVASGAIGGVVGGIAAGKMKNSNGGGGNGGGGGGSFKGDSMSDNFGGKNTNSSLTGELGKSIKNKISNSGFNETFAGQKLSKAGKGIKNLYNSSGGKMTRGVTKAVGGAILAGSGAVLGSSELSKAGKNVISKGISSSTQSGLDMTSDLAEKIRSQELQTDDLSHIGGYDNGDGTRTDRFDANKLAEIGIEDMAVGKDDSGKSVLRQKINPEKLNSDFVNYLESIKTDANGNVDFSFMDKEVVGLTNLKKTADGKYVASFDLNQIALNSVKKSGKNYIVNQNNHRTGDVSQEFIKDLYQKVPAKPNQTSRATAQIPVPTQTA